MKNSRIAHPWRLLPVKIMLISAILAVSSCNNKNVPGNQFPVRVSDDKRSFVTKDNKPFFWLGDTGWLIFRKLSREEASRYLDIRQEKGFNVIQAMLLHDIKNPVNFYGDSAFISGRIDRPLVTEGNDPTNHGQYDYWDHIEYIIDLASEKGICVALVPIWGSNIRSGKVSKEMAGKYSEWLGERFGKKENIIWINGGDIRGSDSTEIWETIGENLNNKTPGILITFHPFGRTKSSTWFHNATWLDFNMFQSGHKRYGQDTSGLAYGEDNWRYMEADYNLSPVRPSFDGEPSYEGIPQGLHDTLQPYWNDSDVRRYAYWSVFAGGAGFTYGHNSVMQFYRKGKEKASYGAREDWTSALNSPGAKQMKYLKDLMLSRPCEERKPAQYLLSGSDGERYGHVALIKGKDYVFAYTCNGREFGINSGLLNWKSFTASWYDPKTGLISDAGVTLRNATVNFNPPGDEKDGNDWVLILDRLK